MRIAWRNFTNNVISFLRNDDTVPRVRIVADRDGRLLDDTDLLTEQVSITGALTLDATAWGKMHICSGTAADYTIVAPTAVGNAGKSMVFKMSPSLTKLVTIDGFSTETIDGDVNKKYWSNEYVVLISDGTNLVVGSVKNRNMISRLIKTSQSITTSAAKITLDTTQIDNSGLLANLANNRIVVKRSGYYKISIRSLSSPANVQALINASFYVDGVSVPTSSFNTSSDLTTSYVGLFTSFTHYIAAGSYIEVYMSCEAGTRTMLNTTLLVEELTD